MVALRTERFTFRYAQRTPRELRECRSILAITDQGGTPVDRRFPGDSRPTVPWLITPLCAEPRANHILRTVADPEVMTYCDSHDQLLLSALCSLIHYQGSLRPEQASMSAKVASIIFYSASMYAPIRKKVEPGAEIANCVHMSKQNVRLKVYLGPPAVRKPRSLLKIYEKRVPSSKMTQTLPKSK